MTNKSAFLVRHPHFNGRNLRMIGYADGFSPKQVAFFGTRHKHNTIADAES